MWWWTRRVVFISPIPIQIGAKQSPDDLTGAVYYITREGKLIRVIADIKRPNGITLSPDEKTLYVNDWGGDYLLTYDVQPDGTLKNRRNLESTISRNRQKRDLSAARMVCAWIREKHLRDDSGRSAGLQRERRTSG